MNSQADNGMEEIQYRIHRIRAAVSVVEESHPDDAGPEVYRLNGGTLSHQDFRAGQSDAALMNLAASMIHNIANLHDHLKRWAKGSSNLESAIEDCFANSQELRIIKDLSNRDKHGPSNYGGHSGMYPEVVEVNRVMRIQGQPGVTSCGMHLGANGQWIFSEGSTHKATVTGRVVDNNGNRIGDLYEIALSAVNAWESFATEHGLLQSEPPN